MPSGAPARLWRSRCSAQHDRILAASLENPLETLPSQPPPDLVRQMEQRLPYVSLEPQAGGRYLIRTAAVLPRTNAAREARFVVAIYPVPAQLAALSEAVQDTYSQYGEPRGRCASR